MLQRWWLGALVAAACLLAGCSGDAASPSSPSLTAPTGPRPSSTGTLSIVSPTIGQVIHGSTVDLKVKLTGAKIVPVTSSDVVPNEGHLHVYLDDQLISMTSGTQQIIPDVSAGRHLIRVEFVASDHFPFDPRVATAVSFEVKP
jgi:hypothetical protein